MTSTERSTSRVRAGAGPDAAAVLTAALLLAAAILLAACGSARRSIPFTGEHRIGDDTTLVLGRRVFDAYCHPCHPGGAGGLAPAINNKPLPAFLIKFQVRRGLGAMPAFPEEAVSDDELDAVAAYLKFLRRLEVNESAFRPAEASDR